MYSLIPDASYITLTAMANKKRSNLTSKGTILRYIMICKALNRIKV